MSAVVILGVFVADVSFRADRLPRMGETILGQEFSLGPGGKGSNQAVAAGRAGGDVTFVSRLGEDTFGQIALDVWSEAGVTPALTRGGDTGAAFIFLDAASGENAVIVAPGVAGTLSVDDVDARADLIGGARVFVTQLEQPMDAAFRALQVARDGGAITILNPAPAADVPEEMLALCDYVTPNETEAESLSGIAVHDLTSARAAADALLSMGVGTVLMTLGAEGALLHSADRSLHVPALSAGPVVATVGAGDAFNGGFATALSEGASAEDAVRFATAVAALSVTRDGAAASMPHRQEIDALLQSGAA
ncbi:ribokinase [Jannaschia sp. 2305UL9-9]|uniref:ribokinase n=1 Tax=Jannaschia sp. 2305UL9-9 TaxID=3121638 RepID=UPI0035295F1A